MGAGQAKQSEKGPYPLRFIKQIVAMLHVRPVAVVVHDLRERPGAEVGPGHRLAVDGRHPAILWPSRYPDAMEAGHDRRAFFRQLLRGAAQTAVEVNEALRGAQEPEAPAVDDEFQMTWGGGSLDARPVAAEPTSRVATEADLRSLAAEFELEARVDDVLAHAQASVRLTGGESTGRSHLGGAPDLPAGFEWPTLRDADLAFLGQLDLAEAAALEGSLPLPGRGLLLFFYDLARRPDGQQPGDRGSVRVLHVEDEELERAGEERAELVELPLRLSGELTLPGESAGLPASLELGFEELDAWQRLRERLAELQGVEVEDRAVDWHALHRVLGHPDTTHDSMALDAQLVVNGIDLNTGERYFDPRVGELEAGAEEWRLLFQLSSDDELGLALGHPLGRLHVWIQNEELRRGRFDDVWAFVR